MAAYEPERGAIVWTIGFFPSGKEFSMRARFGFPSVKAGIMDLLVLPQLNFRRYYRAQIIAHSSQL
jgi:hypothetical protein